MAAARASMEEKRGLTSDKEADSDEENADDVKAARSSGGATTEANSIYGQSSSSTSSQVRP